MDALRALILTVFAVIFLAVSSLPAVAETFTGALAWVFSGTLNETLSDTMHRPYHSTGLYGSHAALLPRECPVGKTFVYARYSGKLITAAKDIHAENEEDIYYLDVMEKENAFSEVSAWKIFQTKNFPGKIFSGKRSFENFSANFYKNFFGGFSKNFSGNFSANFSGNFFIKNFSGHFESSEI